jgi:hypothetical protein
MTHMTKVQAQRLAEFIHLARGEWNTPGILAALEQAAPTATVFDVARALINIAEDATVKTPGMLNQPGTHWRKPDGSAIPRRGDHDVPCPEHHLSMPCRACKERDEANALTPEQIAEQAAALRALIQPTRQVRPGHQEEA